MTISVDHAHERENVVKGKKFGSLQKLGKLKACKSRAADYKKQRDKSPRLATCFSQKPRMEQPQPVIATLHRERGRLRACTTPALRVPSSVEICRDEIVTWAPRASNSECRSEKAMISVGQTNVQSYRKRATKHGEVKVTYVAFIRPFPVLAQHQFGVRIAPPPQLLETRPSSHG